MIRHDLPTDRWRKSTRSGPQQADCLEIQLTDDGQVAIGDSKARERGAFLFTPGGWNSFVAAVKQGQVDC
ncbi:DUF397 domain-containing protein [Streptomyces noursei]|uniref:DUF397 domain-containing protein n=1 Tax=Streptomyces noursei TaxID=1971 RepID=UPI0038213FE9